MLTSLETIKLYFIINKLMYKQSELGYKVYTKSRNPDFDSKDFQQILTISSTIKALLEKDFSIKEDGVLAANFLGLEGNAFERHLDYITLKFNLDPIPYLDFPQNTVNYITTGDTVSVGSGGDTLPLGGGVGFYLTKNSSGNVIWKEIDYFSDFNQI